MLSEVKVWLLCWRPGPQTEEFTNRNGKSALNIGFLYEISVYVYGPVMKWVTVTGCALTPPIENVLPLYVVTNGRTDRCQHCIEQIQAEHRSALWVKQRLKHRKSIIDHQVHRHFKTAGIIHLSKCRKDLLKTCAPYWYDTVDQRCEILSNDQSHTSSKTSGVLQDLCSSL